MKQLHRNRQDRDRGFTIVEIMVVVVILGLLTTAVMTNVFGNVEDANLTAVKRDLVSIQNAAKKYRLKHKSVPESIEDLVNPEEGRAELERVPKDPWGNEYQMDGTDKNGNPIIRCAGNDKEFDTEDDITTENMYDLTELPKIDQGG